MTAGVLVRRGYGDPEAARRFLDGELPAHDPFLLGDMRGGLRARSAPRSRPGQRICVHGDYDVDGICATALAVLVLRELGADVDWHLPSRFEEGYGVARRDARAARRRGLRARPDRRLRHHRRRGGRARRARSGSRSSSPTTTGPARRCRTARSSRPGRRDYPFPELCGTGVVYKLGQALLGADSEVARRGTSTSSRSRRSPTSCRSSTRTARSRSPACARSRGRRSPGLRALMRAARRRPGRGRRGRRRLPARAAHQRRRPARPSRAPRSSCCSPTTQDEARRLADAARGAEPRPPGGRGADPARGDRAGRGVARGPSARRRGYVVAGEDWHEGVIGIVASRLVERYQPPGRADRRRRAATGRAPAARSRLRPARRRSPPAPRTSSASAATARRPASRSSRSTSRRSRSVRRASPTSCLGDDDLRPVTHGRRRRAARRRSTLELCAELARLAPFGLGNPGVTLLARGLRARRARHRRRRQAPALPRPPTTAATPAARSRSASARSSTASAA